MVGDIAQQFASDNYAGICPEAWEAMAEANAGHAPAYGDDRWTANAPPMPSARCSRPIARCSSPSTARRRIRWRWLRSASPITRDLLGRARMSKPTSAARRNSFPTAPSCWSRRAQDGKLTPAAIARIARTGIGHSFSQAARGDHHASRPRPGRSTAVEEMQAISAACRELGLSLHMDGARFANACASLGCTPADMTWKAGVDVLCFGGTKNGMAVGEAIIFFNRPLGAGLRLPLQAGRAARLQDALPVGALGAACWKAAPGCATRTTPMLARAISPSEIAGLSQAR